jgi:hypothetical protein
METQTGETEMTKQEIEDAITDLLEVRREISRVNAAAGHTVFNPAATGAIVAVIERLREEVTETA